MPAPMPLAPAAVDPELAVLNAQFGDRWTITRRIDHGGALGACHAVRHDPRPSLQGLSAHTAAGLWAAIEYAEAIPR